MQEGRTEGEGAFSPWDSVYFDEIFSDVVYDVLLRRQKDDNFYEELDLEYWGYVSKEITDFVRETGYDDGMRERFLRDGFLVLRNGNSLKLKVGENERYIESEEEYYGGKTEHTVPLEII